MARVALDQAGPQLSALFCDGGPSWELHLDAVEPALRNILRVKGRKISQVPPATRLAFDGWRKN